MDFEENCLCAFETIKLQYKTRSLKLLSEYTSDTQLMRQHKFPFVAKTVRLF